HFARRQRRNESPRLVRGLVGLPRLERFLAGHRAAIVECQRTRGQGDITRREGAWFRPPSSSRAAQGGKWRFLPRDEGAQFGKVALGEGMIILAVEEEFQRLP